MKIEIMVFGSKKNVIRLFHYLKVGEALWTVPEDKRPT